MTSITARMKRDSGKNREHFAGAMIDRRKVVHRLHLDADAQRGRKVETIWLPGTSRSRKPPELLEVAEKPLEILTAEGGKMQQFSMAQA